MRTRLDLGHQHFLEFLRLAPDDLPANRERYGTPLPVVERCGAVVYHPNLKLPGVECSSVVHFDLPELRPWFKDQSMWQVQSFDPLTLSPSLLCIICGDHGFIREGKWVPA